jgi:hypothetical protein
MGEHEFWKKINRVCGSCLFKNSFALADSAPSCGSGRISGDCRLGCALGLRKRQQICRSSGGSSIGSCGIGCCGGGGSVGAAAAGCTLTVGAAGGGLVGAGGVLRLRPRSLHYALAARALPSRLGLCPRGSRYALAARASPSRLGFALAAWLRPRGSCYTLAARAAAAAAVAEVAVEATAANARPLGLLYTLAGSGFALAARLRPLRPRGLRYALAARLRPNTTIKQQSSGRKSCFGSTAAYLPQR